MVREGKCLLKGSGPQILGRVRVSEFSWYISPTEYQLISMWRILFLNPISSHEALWFFMFIQSWWSNPSNFLRRSTNMVGLTIPFVPEPPSTLAWTLFSFKRLHLHFLLFIIILLITFSKNVHVSSLVHSGLHPCHSTSGSMNRCKISREDQGTREWSFFDEETKQTAYIHSFNLFCLLFIHPSIYPTLIG